MIMTTIQSRLLLCWCTESALDSFTTLVNLILLILVKISHHFWELSPQDGNVSAHPSSGPFNSAIAG